MSNATVSHVAVAPNAQRLLWAGFLAILAAGIGAGVRGGILANWAADFGFTGAQLGAIGGAVVGNRIAKNRDGTPYTGPAYRVTVQTDQGQWRTYEVGATGDLRVGDRVRVDNGVIYRS